MPTVKYVSAQGEEKTVELAVGTSVMQGAVDNLIEEIVAECGGACSCATCHCYVDEAWVDKVGKGDEMEADLLECVVDLKPNSRLSCQLIMADELDGLVIHLPESQF